MMQITYILTLFILITHCFAQGPGEAVDLQRITDDILAAHDEDANYEDLYENLVQILSSPYDLNTVSAAELRSLHILDDGQINLLLAYRESHGNFLDVHELQAVPGLDLSLISKMAPFVRVADPRQRINESLINRILSPGQSYVILRYERTLEKKKGFLKSGGLPPPYLGSPGKMYFRMRASKPGDFSVGVTGEKDAGEQMAFNPGVKQWGFDFTSWHVQLQNKGKLKNIIAGDFQTQFGQGLLLGGAFGLGKGGESISTTRKSNLGFLPYTSINESAYQRGVAVTWQLLSPVRISAFFSKAGRDATIMESPDSSTVMSVLATGYHRTRGELVKRKSISEKHYGTIAQFTSKGIDAGLILDAIRFDIAVKKNPTLYNQYAFSGVENLNAGIFLNYGFQNVSFFSEVAMSRAGGKAAVGGLLLSAHRNFDVAIVYRNYQPDFHAFYANAFSESTQPQNERGLYWGWKYRWNRQYNFSGYFDLFTFPWLGFRRYAPSGGHEWMVRFHYQPTKKASLLVQLRTENKFRNFAEPSPVYQVGKGEKRNVTMHCDYGFGERIRLRSRLQYNQYHLAQQLTEGMALVQDVTFSFGRFRLTARHGLFETDHYDNRHYMHEHDAWLAYSLPAYSGAGVRNYVLFEFKVHKQATLWFRYARTRRTDGGEIGTGPEVIEGNTKNDVKFQALFRF